MKYYPKLLIVFSVLGCVIAYSYQYKKNMSLNIALAEKAKSSFKSLGLPFEGLLMYKENTANTECNQSTYSVVYAIEDSISIQDVCLSIEKRLSNAAWKSRSGCRSVAREKTLTRHSFNSSILRSSKKMEKESFLIKASFYPSYASHAYFTPFTSETERKIIALSKAEEKGFYFIEITYRGQDKFRRNCQMIIVSDEPCECIYKTYKHSHLENEEEQTWFD